MENYEIADQFSLLAKLMDIHGENTFKSKSYSIAAFNIEKIETPIRNIPREKLFSVKGIGESTGKKILEIIDTGELSVLTSLVQKTPPGILEMMKIKGIGPKKINVIWKQLEIESLGELLYACNENRLLLYKGFGEKTQANISNAISFYMNNMGSYLFAQIETYAKQMDETLKKEFSNYKIELSGLIRRQMETIDLLEWCTTAPPETIRDFFTSHNFELMQESTEHLLFKGAENVEIKIHLANEDLFYKKVFTTSCSEPFLSAWENEFPLPPNKIESEEQIFELASVQIIPSFLRESPNIIIQAKNKTLPVPVQVNDIKAIIHSHSNWSDGVNTIEEMAEELIKRKFEFLVISDHSKSAFYAKGLTHERIIAQQQYIDELNNRFSPFKIFKSIECDILNDGSLDYTDDILKTFDLVIASVHSNLKMTEDKAMSRLLKAIENPYVMILGHMTGRLLLSRNGYPVDHKKIIDACAANHVAIELNAHPRRLDMDWRWIHYALEKQVMISVDPDAHDLDGFNDIRYGVLAAQKAGLTKENNLSCFSLREFENYLTEMRKRKNIS